MSVTYGAGGSTRQKTVELVERIQNEIGIRSMAHLTCVGHTADEIGSILDDLWKAGIRNVLALRGDPQAGQTQFVKTEGGFGYADELVQYAAARHDFCVGVAGYPEGHPQCLNRTRDLEHLKRKVDNGGELRRHAVVLRQRRLLPLPRRRPGDGDHRPDRGRHHADPERQPDQAVHLDVRRQDPPPAAAEARVAGARPRSRPRRRRGLRHRAVPGPAEPRRSTASTSTPSTAARRRCRSASGLERRTPIEQ